MFLKRFDYQADRF